MSFTSDSRPIWHLCQIKGAVYSAEECYRLSADPKNNEICRGENIFRRNGRSVKEVCGSPGRICIMCLETKSLTEVITLNNCCKTRHRNLCDFHCQPGNFKIKQSACQDETKLLPSTNSFQDAQSDVRGLEASLIDQWLANNSPTIITAEKTTEQVLEHI
ncbi:MAG: hypothetical protein WCK11_02205 [Candidatus Falkowbacteria bacterium]